MGRLRPVLAQTSHPSTPPNGDGNAGSHACGHASCHEGQEARLRPSREAPRLLWQDHQDCDGPEENGPVQEQGGRTVSKKKSALGKKNAWIVAVQAARKALKIKGFSVVRKGTPLYKKAKELM